MSDLKTVPKAHIANIVHIADFTEIECLRRADRNVSSLDISRIITRATDASNEETVELRVSEAFDELGERACHCGEGHQRYPYEVSANGRLLSLREETTSVFYFYLLLATRMNMKTERKQGGEDATVLFEHLCCEVAERFWGGPNSSVRSMVFGTGRAVENKKDHEEMKIAKFESAVNKLCEELQEGFGFQSADGSKVTAKDGKLDVVVWRRFADRRAGQLIGFGQCKTGRNWEQDLMKLRPEGFCSKWLIKPLAVAPVRLYFVADRVRDRWYDRCIDGGIFLDRCRIIELADNISSALEKRIAAWLKAAATQKKLSLP